MVGIMEADRDIIGTEQAHLKMFNRQCAKFFTVFQKLPQISEYFPRTADGSDIFGKIFLMRLFLSQLDLLYMYLENPRDLLRYCTYTCAARRTGRSSSTPR
jgi:hypothetical protein